MRGLGFSTTTRSPVLAVDDPGYAIRTRLVFPAHDRPADGRGAGHGGSGTPTTSRRRTALRRHRGGRGLPGDSPELHAPGGLLAPRRTHRPPVLAVVPSYVPRPRPSPRPRASQSPRTAAPHATPNGRSPHAARAAARPRFLLATRPTRSAGCSRTSPTSRWKRPTEEREEAIQSGGAHYAESLPVEYQPSEQYQALFHSALRTSARRIARAVGAVTDTVLAERSARAPRAAGAGLAGPGRHPRRGADAPLGAARARPGPAALRRLDRARPGHRHHRTALAGRAPRPGGRRLRGRLDRQGRHHPRTRAGAGGLRRASTRGSPSSPTPAAASRPTAPATTSSSRRPA